MGTHLASQRGLLMEQILDSETQRRRGVAFRPGALSSSCSLLTPPKPLVRPATDTQAPEVADQSDGPLCAPYVRSDAIAVSGPQAPSAQHRADDTGDTRALAERIHSKFKLSSFREHQVKTTL